jgi:predicted RNase H-like HicB family nuclease
MTVNEYLKLPYHYVFQKVGKNWEVSVKELPFCHCKDKTLQRAYIKIKTKMKGWIENALPHIEIPLPKEE